VNNKDRKTLSAAIDSLIALLDEDTLAAKPLVEVKSIVEAAESVVSELAESERDKFDNMSEGLQESATGQAIEEAADALENVTWPSIGDHGTLTADEVSDLIAEIQNVVDELEGI